jgi:hypothetical protein
MTTSNYNPNFPPNDQPNDQLCQQNGFEITKEYQNSLVKDDSFADFAFEVDSKIVLQGELVFIEFKGINRG